MAQRISSINSISALCEETGADIKQVSLAVGTDSRIGEKFLNPSPGFGGSCFQKDILNLIYLCEFYKLDEVASYWQSVLNINNWQKLRISKIVVNKLFGNISDKKISILGFAFKANTNDTRNSPCIDICNDLIEEGANLSIYDPKVDSDQIAKDLNLNCREKGKDKGSWEFCNSLEESAYNSHAILVLTEWDEFKNIEWEEIYKIMKKPCWLFDTRFCTNSKTLLKIGFNYWGLGSQ